MPLSAWQEADGPGGQLWHTDGARSALRAALQREGFRSADALAGAGLGEALLPAYLCDTLIGPFRQHGLSVRFYDVNPDLTVDMEDLDRRMTSHTRAVLFIHYFGFLQPEPVRQFFADLREKGVGAAHPLIFEDLTHAVWTDLPEGPVGDYAVASYRKFGQPFDGGFLWARGGADGAGGGGRPEPELNTWASPAHCLSALAWALEASETDSPSGGGRRPDGPSTARTLWDGAERHYDRDRVARSMAPGSKRMWEGLDREALVACRRAAYRQALETAAACPHGEALRPHLPPGVCPLVLPMRAGTPAERGPMRAWLARKGLNTVLLWPPAPGVERDDFPGAAETAACLASVVLPLPPGDNRAL